MESLKEFTVICHFSAIARKRVNAESYEDAKQIAETDSLINFDEILEITEPCKVDEIVISNYGDQSQYQDHAEYKSWGSE
jgi:ABC-type transport system involved in Fe-S cluster assembly fused permease/ATPase subunit